MRVNFAGVKLQLLASLRCVVTGMSLVITKSCDVQNGSRLGSSVSLNEHSGSSDQSERSASRASSRSSSRGRRLPRQPGSSSSKQKQQEASLPISPRHMAQYIQRSAGQKGKDEVDGDDAEEEEDGDADAETRDKMLRSGPWNDKDSGYHGSENLTLSHGASSLKKASLPVSTLARRLVTIATGCG